MGVNGFPPHKTNGHTISVFGRLLFWATSNSRKGLDHLVDLEGGTFLDEKGREHKWMWVCTCESFRYGERPCRHIVGCFDAMAAWNGVAEEFREAFSDRLRFLLTMGRSFQDAVRELAKTSAPKPEKPAVRNYHLPKR